MTQQRKLLPRPVWVLILTAGAFLLWLLSHFLSPRSVVGTRPECPEDSIVIQILARGQVIKTVKDIPLSTPISNIPEYHDCQRFIEPDGKSYGSLYAIFAAFRLENLPTRLKQHSDSQPAGTNEQHSLPGATVYSYGDDYAALGVRAGFNCLHLYQVKDGGWNAWMVPQDDPADEDCTHAPSLPVAQWTPLRVVVDSLPGLTDADVPPVARWDWDSTDHLQYIGIKCGPAWCEVGSAKGLKVSPQYQGPALEFDPVGGAPSLTPEETIRVTQVKGWYDAQFLAQVVPGATPITTQPSAVWGILVPSPALDGLDHPAEFTKGWVHTADAVLDGDYKHNLKKGVNKLYLCHGEMVQAAEAHQPGLCPMSTTPVTGVAPACPVDPTDSFHLPWWGKTVAADNTVEYRCVNRADHGTVVGAYKFAIPGVVRWRWLVDDETTWMRCPTGCCTIK